VTGPLGDPVEAGWRLEGETAFVEMARASGLELAGGAGANDPLRATTRGTGELVAAAASAGARRIVVGVGGSATTDGGLGALEALDGLLPFGDHHLEVQVACDVTTMFTDAAVVFAPQKGAGPEDVEVLTGRLRGLLAVYEERFGRDIAALPGGGAAGGLAGGLAAAGASVSPGFELVAGLLGLDGALAGAELVLTGEGRLDATSFAGKVVGGVVARCRARDIPVVAVVGDAAPETRGCVDAISLVERFGPEQALHETAVCVRLAVEERLGGRCVD
jgi:glycerate kinase